MVCCDTFKLYQKIAAPAELDITLAHVVISITLLIDCSAQLRADLIHTIFFMHHSPSVRIICQHTGKVSPNYFVFQTFFETPMRTNKKH